MAKILFGPLISRIEPGESLHPDLVHTGNCVEFAGDEISGRLNIYRKRPRHLDDPGCSYDYLISTEELTFGVRYTPYLSSDSSRGLMVTLEEAMASLYRNHNVVQPLVVFLVELKRSLKYASILDDRRRPDGAALVHPVVSEAGFQVTRYFQYGTGLTIYFGWFPPNDTSDPDLDGAYAAGCAEFRPGPGRTLGKGKWIEPSRESFTWLLMRQMKKLRRGDPAKWLSEEGIRVALEEFKFTKVTLLRRKELIEARLTFIRDHPELRDDPTEMARALKADGLWSNITELGAIRKQLPKLMTQL